MGLVTYKRNVAIVHHVMIQLILHIYLKRCLTVLCVVAQKGTHQLPEKQLTLQPKRS